jgi:hypothetical protein
MQPLRVRALEIHSSYVWNFDWVRKALAFIRANEMTSLVLHRNDIVDLVVYPGRLFGSERQCRNIFERYQDIHRTLYKYTPTRRSGPYQRRDYLRRVVDLAARSNIDVYLENKELSFHDIFVELNPQLTKNGTLCPNEPFWWDFVAIKYRELFEDLPGIAGIITAPGTGESRLSIAANRCTCELCRGVTPAEWYTKLIKAMHEPIRAAGKTLAIRDFVFDRAAQDQLVRAIANLPADIVVSLKNTPHDYYPTFPDNPRIGEVAPHPQWVEFDCMGQYFGWGIGPAIMIEDMRRRLRRADEAGVEGAIFRTDWESLDSHSAFHTPNLVNLYAGAALSRDRQAAAPDIFHAWLLGEGLTRTDASAADIEAVVRWAERLFGASWEIVRRSLYTQDCVFSDSSTYPVSLAHAWWLAEEKNSLKDWDPAKADALATSEDNVRRILTEKAQALALVEALPPIARERPAALADAAHADLLDRIDIFCRYVRGFHAIGRACILTKYLIDHPDGSAFRQEAQAGVQRALQDLLGLADEFEAFAAASDHRYTVYVLLGHERLRALHQDLSTRLAAQPVSAVA